MYSGLGEPVQSISSSPTEGILPEGPLIPSPGMFPAPAGTTASIVQNALWEGQAGVTSANWWDQAAAYADLQTIGAGVPTWVWIAGAGAFALLALGGRRR